MTSKVPSSIYIFDPETLETRFKFTPAGDAGDVKDLPLSPDDDGKLYVMSHPCYCHCIHNGQPDFVERVEPVCAVGLGRLRVVQGEVCRQFHVIITAIANLKSKAPAWVDCVFVPS